MPTPRARKAVLASLAPLLLAALTSCGLLPGSDEGDGPGDAANAAVAPTATGPGAAPGRPRVPGEITLAFAGDVHFAERTEPLLVTPAEGGVLGPIGATLADADLAMVNLETAITTRGTPEAKKYTFRAPPSALTRLQEAGVDVLSMANNHAVDYGKTGLQDTLAALTDPPVGVVGLGADATAAYRPWIREVNGVKVAFLAASQVQDLTNARYRAGADTPGIATALVKTRLVQAVRDAKKRADVVVVYMHWGIEGQKCPNSDQTGLARSLSDAGATAILGTHAHVMQGAGWMGDTYVGYGYGNFLWYGTSPYPNSDDTGVATLTVKDGKVVREEFTPAVIDARGVPMPQSGAEAKRILDRRAGLLACTGLSATPKGKSGKTSAKPTGGTSGKTTGGTSGMSGGTSATGGGTSGRTAGGTPDTSGGTSGNAPSGSPRG